jgi:hypothetical protein
VTEGQGRRAEGGIEGRSTNRFIPDEAIRAWPPGVGLSPDQAKSVRVCKEFHLVGDDEVVEAERKSHTKDWVVLEIIEDDAAQEPGILENEWLIDGKEAFPKFGLVNRYCVVGYPGGAESLKKGISYPTKSSLLALREVMQGLVVLNGDETRPGMSGGGVFAYQTLFGTLPLPWKRPLLAGIHRGRDNNTLQLSAVSTELIRSYINSDSIPFEISRSKRRRAERAMAPLFGALIFVAFAALSWWFLNRPTELNLTVYRGDLINGNTSLELLSGVKVGLLPSNCKLKWLSEAMTDSNGRGVVRFVSDSSTKIIKGSFVITDAPELEQPIVTTTPVFSLGDGTLDPRGEGVKLEHGDNIKLVVVPEAIYADYMAAFAYESMRRGKQYATSSGVEDKFKVVANEVDNLGVQQNELKKQMTVSVAARVFSELPEMQKGVFLENELQLINRVSETLAEDDPELKLRLENRFAKVLLRSRPNIPAISDYQEWSSYKEQVNLVIGGEFTGSEGLSDDLLKKSNSLAESVCYIGYQSSVSDKQLRGTGFVVGDGIVLTGLDVLSFQDEVDDGIFIGFGGNPEAESDPTRLAVSKVISFKEPRLALLKVPNLRRPALRFFSGDKIELTYSGEMFVIGYCTNHFWPRFMQNVLSFSTNGEKRIAFGSFVVNQTSGEDIDSYELSHSALTSAGTLGSPIIDAKNGLVIGVHHGGQWSSERNKGNSGVAWTKVVESVDFNAILE